MKEGEIINLVDAVQCKYGKEAVFIVNLDTESLLGIASKITSDYLTIKTFFGGNAEVPFNKILLIRHMPISEILTIANGLIHQIRQHSNRVDDDRSFLSRHNLHI